MKSKDYIKEIVLLRKTLKKIYKDNGNPCEPLCKSILTEFGIRDVFLHIEDLEKTDVYELVNPYRIVGEL